MAQDDPIGEFIALPRDQQMATLQSLSPEKQDKLLGEVKKRRSQPAPWQKITDTDVQQGPLPSGQDPQQIIQEMTGIHPFKNPAAQAGMGPVRAVGGLLKSPWDIGKSFFTGAQNPEEAQLEQLGGRPELVAKRMLIDPGRAALEQSSGLQQESRQLLETSRLIEANAGTEEGRRMLKQRFPQMNFNTEKDAREQASGLRWRSIRTYGSKVLSDVQSIPIVGGMARMGGERWAAGDPLGAFTETATNAVMMADPHIPGTKMTVNEALVGKPMEYSLNVARKLPQGVRRTAQFITGVSPDIVRRAKTAEVERYGKEVPEVEEANKKAVYEQLQDIGVKMRQNREAQEQFQQRLDALNERNKVKKEKFETKKQKIRDKNDELTGEHQTDTQQKIQDFNALTKEHTEGQATRQERDATEDQAFARVGTLQKEVKAKVDDEWSAMRTTMDGAETPREDVVADVENARNEFQGSREKVREFDEILHTARGQETEAMRLANDTAKNQGYEDFADMWAKSSEQSRDGWKRILGEDVVKEVLNPPLKPMDWNELQAFYTELGRRRYSGMDITGRGKLPGDVYRAIKKLHESIGKRMYDLAEERGAGAQLTATKASYEKFMDTFHDTSSPVAQALGADLPSRAAAKFRERDIEKHPAFKNLQSYDSELAAQFLRLRGIRRVATKAETSVKPVLDLEKFPDRPQPEDPESVPEPRYEKAKNLKPPTTKLVDPLDLKKATPAQVDPWKVREEALKASAKQSGFWGQGDVFFYAQAVSQTMGGILGLVAGKGAEGAGLGALTGGAIATVAVPMMRRWMFNRLDSDGVLKFLTKPPLADVKYLEELSATSPEAAAIVAEQIKKIRAQYAPQAMINPRIARFIGRAAVVGRGATTTASEPEKRAREAVERLTAP